MLQICHNCFSEYEGVGLCPYCGFNAAEEKRQPLALPGGTILGGRYIVGRVLGQGGFGITYAAQDYNSKAMVAIKEHFPTAIVTRTGKSTVSIIDEKMRESFEEGKDKFLAEAKTLSQFNGLDNICDIYSYFEENGTAYFAMEYVDGISLDKHLKTLDRPLSFDEAAALLLPAMEALSHVHEKGIIHRDIAPDNIMVTENEDVMLIDFGAARYSMGEKSRSLDVILKHGFAPKEQYARHSRQGAYTDVYAMAATLYYAITGNVPPDAIERTDIDELIPPSRLGIKIPRKAEAALMKALAVNYTQRWQTMGEFSAALKKELSPDRAAPEARRKAEVQRSGKAAKSERPKKKKPVALIAALAALAIGAGAFFGVGGDKAESPVLSESEAPVFTETPVATEIPAPTEEPDYMEWNLDENGTLFIRGKGAMPDYMNTDDLPWAQEHGEGKIKALVIERGITHIGAITAGACWTLEEVSIADTVTSIGSAAFMDCDSLKKVTIPGSVTRIMGQAFEHCDYVIIEFKGTEEQWKKINIVPQGNDVLKTSAVTYKYVDGGYAGGKVRWGIDSNGALTFSGEGEMYDYTPGNTPWYHGYYGGGELIQLHSVVIEEGVTKIGDAAFNNSEELSSVTIADSVRSIGDFAFNNCPSLTSLVIPNGVTSIGEYAFCRCEQLESITIPDSVTSIGRNAFNACPQLRIEYEGGKEQWDELRAR